MVETLYNYHLYILCYVIMKCSIIYIMHTRAYIKMQIASLEKELKHMSGKVKLTEKEARRCIANNSQLPRCACQRVA